VKESMERGEERQKRIWIKTRDCLISFRDISISAFLSFNRQSSHSLYIPFFSHYILHTNPPTNYQQIYIKMQFSTKLSVAAAFAAVANAALTVNSPVR
jgi:hypothetical protein